MFCLHQLKSPHEYNKVDYFIKTFTYIIFFTKQQKQTKGKRTKNLLPIINKIERFH